MILKEKISKAFDQLQTMEIKATKGNMDALEYALIVLREVYLEIEKQESAIATATGDKENKKAGEESGAV